MAQETERESGWKYLQPADLKRLHNLQFAARLMVEGIYQGRHRSPYHDFSAEFADYRPYSPGDEIRTVDWRAYARTDRYYVKLFRKETDQTSYLVVDTSRSMGFAGGDGVTKLEYASYLTAALSYLMIRQGDKSSLTLGSDALGTFLPAGGTMRNLQNILRTLEKAAPAGNTGLATVLRTLFGIAPRKGMLIVFSDFLEEPGPLFSVLSRFVHRGFAVLLFHLLTDEEMNLPDTDSALFQDMESPLMVAAEPDAIRQAYRAEILAYLQEIEGQAKARRIHYHLALTSTPYHRTLETYLAARQRL